MLGIFKKISSAKGALSYKERKAKMACRDDLNESVKRNLPVKSMPIKYQVAEQVSIVPEVPGHENLPPFQQASYSAATPTSLPKISFQQIYHHMILRKTTDGRPINNFKGLDRAVKHFEAGDVSQITTAQV